ncbi:transposase, partial [Streptomyces sp. NPDC048425]|uniref:transposase n=1 Tax=Streptomyces sp. NPDC048425 TaxID=3365548 RepID=UPI003714DAA4
AFFRRWREHGLITEFHDRLRGRVREREGREAEPTAGIIDAQSVRAAATVPAASRGYDGGKKVPGRKRHIVTDTLGLLLAVAVTAANTGDRDAATGLLGRVRRLHRDITLVWADGGYRASVRAVDSAVDTARASTNSSRAITRRSSSISAASSTSANRATSSRRPSTRTAPGQQPPAPPAFPAPTCAPSVMKRTQDAACLPHSKGDHA